MSTRAYVAGATGYTGQEVVRLYGEAGREVWAHVRPDSSRLPEHRERIESHGGQVDVTPWDLDAMTRRLTELAPTVVYALLGTTKKRAASEGMDAARAYETIDYGLTALMIQASVACGHRPRFMYISMAALNENSRNPYVQARVRAEADLVASGLPYTILRPAFITGTDREDTRPVERLSSTLIDGALRVASVFGAKALRARYASLSATQLAAGMIRAADDPDAAGTILYPDDLRDARANAP